MSAADTEAWLIWLSALDRHSMAIQRVWSIFGDVVSLLVLDVHFIAYKYIKF